MLFQTLDNKHKCIGVYYDGNLYFNSELPEGISETWSYASFLADREIRYGNFFFIILYTLLGSLFFTVFHNESFWLAINGNNGFIGNLFEESFIINLININQTISYYLIIFVIFIIFLKSINFKVKFLIQIFKRILGLFYLTRKG